MKRFLALCLALVLLLALTACGGEEKAESEKKPTEVTEKVEEKAEDAKTEDKTQVETPADETEEEEVEGASQVAEVDIDDVLALATDAISNLNSVRIDTKAVINITDGVNTMKTTNNTLCDMDLKNNLAYYDMNIDAGGQKTSMKMYANLTEPINCYINNSGTGWLSMKGLSLADMGLDGAMTNAAETTTFYYQILAADENAVLSTATFNGTKCYKISSEVDMSDMNTVKKFGMDTTFSAFMSQGTDVEEVFSRMAPLDFTIYIDCETYRISGFEMNMLNMMESLMATVEGGDSVDVIDAVTTAFYSNHNQVSVKIPEEALNATAMN